MKLPTASTWICPVNVGGHWILVVLFLILYLPQTLLVFFGVSVKSLGIVLELTNTFLFLFQQIVKMEEKSLLVIDPLGNENVYQRKILRNWR